MATITLTGVRSHDYSTDVLSNIDVIKFHTTKSTTIKYHTARFSAAQFDNVHISTAVNIIGDNNADRVLYLGLRTFQPQLGLSRISRPSIASIGSRSVAPPAMTPLRAVLPQTLFLAGAVTTFWTGVAALTTFHISSMEP